MLPFVFINGGEKVRKLGVMTAIVLMFSSLFPHSLFANEGVEAGERNVESEEVIELKKENNILTEEEQVTDDGNEEIDPIEEDIYTDETNTVNSLESKISPSQEVNDEQYNELGVKIGTMVHGEDISELSERELQYIPEGWRDGILESEHPEEEDISQSLMKSKKSYPNVNNYIASKKFSTAKVKYDHKNFFTKFNYRGGYGNVEGVVAHETANSKSNINGEIAYMSTNHKNAFVHAFVDDANIIEIHPTELGAWGAGRYANERFVHVELVQVHSFDKFARSIDNYSDYIASILYQYDLGVSDADNNKGEGTLWSHRAVSLILGGTTHVDPHGYFEKWGYNWNDFVKLVKIKHDALVANESQRVSKLGHIKSSNVRIYDDPMNLGKYITAGSKYTHEVYYIKQETVVNGKKYYLMNRHHNNKKHAIGWINAADVSAAEHSEVSKKAEDFVIRGSGKSYTNAWGGSKNLVSNNLSSHQGSIFKVNLIEKVGADLWYRGKLNGKQLWIKQDYISKETTTSRMGHIRNSGVKIYPKLNDGSSAITAGKNYTHQVYYIKKQAKIKNQTFHLISKSPSSVNGVVGWVKAGDLTTQPHLVVDKKTKTLHINGTGNAYSKAWGGSQDIIYKDLSQFKNQQFKVHLTEKVGNAVWHRGTLNGKTVWIKSDLVTDVIEKSTSKLGHIRSTKVRIYDILTDTSKFVTAGNTYTHAVYYIKKEATVNGKKYYLINKNPKDVKGIVGWIKAEDMSIQPHLVVDKKAKTFYVKGSGNAYSKAWGGSKDIVNKGLSKEKNQEFKVHLTESVGNIVWYRGTLNGKTVWIQSTLVAAKKETNTSKLGHIRNANVKIYPKLGDNSSAITAGTTHTHAVYYIKKEAEINGQRFQLLSKNPSSVNGVVGWARAEDMTTNPHLVVDKKNKDLYIKGTGSAYSKAWGGSKDAVFKDLSAKKNQLFKVHLTEKVGNNVWYRGNLSGKTVWIHHSLVNNK